MIGFKGQVSAEFFVFFFTLIVIFFFFFVFSSTMQDVWTRIQLYENADSVAFLVAHTVNNVFLGEEGLSSSIIIPSNYNISTQPRALIVTDSNNVSASASLLTDSVIVSVSENATELNVTNLNGTVEITG